MVRGAIGWDQTFQWNLYKIKSQCISKHSAVQFTLWVRFLTNAYFTSVSVTLLLWFPKASDSFYQKSMHPVCLIVNTTWMTTFLWSPSKWLSAHWTRVHHLMVSCKWNGTTHLFHNFTEFHTLMQWLKNHQQNIKPNHDQTKLTWPSTWLPRSQKT